MWQIKLAKKIFPQYKHELNFVIDLILFSSFNSSILSYFGNLLKFHEKYNHVT